MQKCSRSYTIAAVPAGSTSGPLLGGVCSWEKLTTVSYERPGRVLFGPEIAKRKAAMVFGGFGAHAILHSAESAQVWC
jgi:hypothetical protein